MPRLAKQILEEWVEEVSSQVGRSVEELRTKGLAASDFRAGREIRVVLMDGSFVQFRYAFAIASEPRRAIAVFTEHCGYHVFPNHGVVISEVPRDAE